MKAYLATLFMLISTPGIGSVYAQEEPVNAVVTVGMIGDIVQNVGGECAEVTAIMGPGVDPHLYRAGAADVQTFSNADVIFYAGYSLEGQLGEVFERLAELKPTVAVAPASIGREDLITTQDAYGIDPHLWMDVSLWSRIAPTISKTLGDLRPDCAAQMQANVQRYTEQLTALHDWIGKSIATIPAEQRILVTAHDAFNYYGRAYGIEVAGIQGLSTEAEAAVADIRSMVEVVVERQVPAVFIESTINPRTLESVIQAARVQGQEVEVGGQLYSDAMGEGGTAGGTYIGMIYENTRNITQALGGTVPPLPTSLADWAAQWKVAAN